MSRKHLPISLAQSPAYRTSLGAAYCGDSRDLLAQLPDDSLNLVITSPPFALLREKEYGNKSQSEYIDWLVTFAELVHRKYTWAHNADYVIKLARKLRTGIRK